MWGGVYDLNTGNDLWRRGLDGQMAGGWKAGVIYPIVCDFYNDVRIASILGSWYSNPCLSRSNVKVFNP
jgi:hypothetical protein